MWLDSIVDVIITGSILRCNWGITAIVEERTCSRQVLTGADFSNVWFKESCSLSLGRKGAEHANKPAQDFQLGRPFWHLSFGSSWLVNPIWALFFGFISFYHLLKGDVHSQKLAVLGYEKISGPHVVISAQFFADEKYSVKSHVHTQFHTNFGHAHPPKNENEKGKRKVASSFLFPPPS